jgi:hypothetical protein
MRPRRCADHRIQQCRPVCHQRVEIIEVAALDGAARMPLPAPVIGDDMPTACMPKAERLQIFLDEIAPAAREDERSARRGARRLRPVHPPQRPAVRRRPIRKARALGPDPPFYPTEIHGRWLRFGK